MARERNKPLPPPKPGSARADQPALPEIETTAELEDENEDDELNDDELNNIRVTPKPVPLIEGERRKEAQIKDRHRRQNLKAALQELQTVAYLPTKDDPDAEKNAKTIRAAVERVTSALTLPPE